MQRRQMRAISQVFLFTFAAFLIYLGWQGWTVGSLPAQWVGYLLVVCGVLGLLGVNVWYGGPLDQRNDPPEESADLQNARTVNQAGLQNIEQRKSDTYADLLVQRECIQEGRGVSVEIPGGSTIKIKLPAGMAEGTSLRLPGQAFDGGGDLYLRIMVAD